MIDVTVTRSPPTAWTMSAKIVVVVTTLTAAVAGESPGPEPELGDVVGLGDAALWQAARRIARTASAHARAAVLRLSLINWRMAPRAYVWGGRSVVGRGLGLAVPAEPEQLEPVGIDAVTASAGDLGHGFGNAAVLDVRRPPAARADDMVVVRPSARDVGVLAAGQLETLYDVQLAQQVQGAKERRPADVEPAITGVGLELGGREMAIVLGDEIRDGTPRAGQSIAGLVERDDDRVGVGHAGDDSGIQPMLSRQTRNWRPAFDQDRPWTRPALSLTRRWPAIDRGPVRRPVGQRPLASSRHSIRRGPLPSESTRDRRARERGPGT